MNTKHSIFLAVATLLLFFASTSSFAKVGPYTAIECTFPKGQHPFQTIRFVVEGQNADFAFGTAAQQKRSLPALSRLNQSEEQRVNFTVIFTGVEMGMYQANTELKRGSIDSTGPQDYDVEIQYDFWSLQKMTIALKSKSTSHTKIYSGTCQ